MLLEDAGQRAGGKDLTEHGGLCRLTRLPWLTCRGVISCWVLEALIATPGKGDNDRTSSQTVGEVKSVRTTEGLHSACQIIGAQQNDTEKQKRMSCGPTKTRSGEVFPEVSSQSIPLLWD